ncbi:PLP-dependent aminotransferase family protein (plasmid) [Burkholderia gladioli]|uniref:aminotransferase-like domain-containing protein n=1 Tax=Burkholderia gladioli TaxID=28095 RepID=UPI0019373112|nr:PLP-dependent aminotransferase family protein [Burkholderia gladioli]QPQ89129.1 PLP-dependent aminotransferase family protein [Burkholderia gladioli]
MLTIDGRYPNLNRERLHASLSDPALEAVNFLNEVIDRYPNAISFAPGAPYSGFFDEINIDECIACYADYLKTRTHLSPENIKRKIYQYGPSRGLICDLVANALRLDEQIHVTSNSVVITVGCQEAMFLTLRALFVDKSDVLGIVTPCYVGIVGAARLLDIEIVAVNESPFGIDFDHLAAVSAQIKAKGKKLKALYVAPDFANPSGTLMDLSTRQKVLSVAEAENIFILEDGTYSFTANPASRLPAMKALDKINQVIYFGTFSKICLPGIRVGFVIANQQSGGDQSATRILADDIADLKTMVTVNTSSISQAIIGGLLLCYKGSLSALAEERAKFYQKNLSYLLMELEKQVGLSSGISWNNPRGGFFVRIKLPVVVDDVLLEISARKFGVLWMPMSHFYFEKAESYELRLSCSYLTPEEIKEGISRFSRFIRHVIREGGEDKTFSKSR